MTSCQPDESSRTLIITGLESEDSTVCSCTLLGPWRVASRVALTPSTSFTPPLPLALLQPSMSRVMIVTGGKSPELQGEAQGMQTKLN